MFTYLSALVLCSAMAVGSYAQYSKTVEQYPNSEYATVPATFSLSEIATALGTDTATFAADFTAWIEGGSVEDVCYFYLSPDGQGTFSGSIPGSYWMTRSGEIGGWGSTVTSLNHTPLDPQPPISPERVIQ